MSRMSILCSSGVSTDKHSPRLFQTKPQVSSDPISANEENTTTTTAAATTTTTRLPAKVYTQSDIEALPSSTEGSPVKSSTDVSPRKSSVEASPLKSSNDESSDDDDEDTAGESSDNSSDPHEKINFGQPFSYMTPSFPATSPNVGSVDLQLIKEQKKKQEQELKDGDGGANDECISRASLKTLVHIKLSL